MKYFVWVSGLHGAEAQIWTDDQFVNGKPAHYIFKHKLEPYEEKLSLDELTKFYRDAKEAKE